MKYFVTILFCLFLSSPLWADIINIPADQPNIQAGINAATDGDTVLVADGIYFDNINFKGKAITVASHLIINGDTNHIANTVIDGSLPTHPDSGSVVIFDSGEDTTSVLSGFTITGGTGTIAAYTWQGDIFIERSGGGIHSYNAGAKISDNIITNNHISQFEDTGGGGINIYTGDSGSFALIVNNKINANTVTGFRLGWGAAIEFSGNGVIENNDISANISSATELALGAISCWGDIDIGLGNVLIKDNSIMQNIVTADTALGGGIELEIGMQARITGNTITGNILNGTTYGGGGGVRVLWTTAADTISGNYIADNEVYGSNSYGGGIIVQSTANTNNTVITNNIIARNQAKNGGGIRCRNSIVQIRNNTIVANHASSNGGGIQISGTSADVSILNTILWNNTAPSGAQISGSANVNYSDVQGGASGVGNIFADPLFVDTTAYYLSDNSPCIDAGHPDSVYNDPEDPLNPGFGIPPAMGTLHNDMGAYGGPSSNTIIVVGIEELPSPAGNLPVAFTLRQNYPNPFNPSTTIEFTIAKAGWTTLKVYNVLGEVVFELAAAHLSAGSYKYEWNASGLASGVYFYRLEIAKNIKSRKMLLIQ